MHAPPDPGRGRDLNPDQLLSATAAFLIALGAPVFLRPRLENAGVIDVPNERSSHDTPALRGGGLAQACAIVSTLGYAASVAAGRDRSLLLVVLVTCIGAASLGWLEDLRGLPVKIRAGSQLLIGVAALSIAALSTGHSPWWVLVGGIALIGGVNVVNFMDGVNAISAFHGIVAGSSFVAIGLLNNSDWLVTSGAVLAAAFAAFLPWNLNGRMFLGDVGSYLLGGTIAVVVAIGWMEGLPVIALAAPMTIYITDTAVTLLSRIRSGDRWHEAHRDHTYQRLNRAGVPHLRVAAIVTLASTSTAVAGIGSAEASGRARLSLLLLIALIVCAYMLLRFRLGTSLTQAAQAES